MRGSNNTFASDSSWEPAEIAVGDGWEYCTVSTEDANVTVDAPAGDTPATSSVIFPRTTCSYATVNQTSFQASCRLIQLLSATRQVT